MSKMGAIRRQLLGIVIGGACSFSASCATAQIRPDRTLPNNSSVTINGSVFNITGGSQAGRNLFHSFQQFSLPTGGTAYFNNGLDIQNIISRVTGGTISNIDGIIKANGTANLFLINPNGIVFGKNASLDVHGSFVGTTANAIQFGNLGSFSATNPEAPSPLLTINPSAFLFNQVVAAPIQNNSEAAAGLDLTGAGTFGLRVPDGKSLLLVGGDINMNGGGLYAFGGRVELGGLVSAGTVGVNGDGNILSLSFPNSVERSNVSLSNGAQVNVRAGDGGSIVINAQNLEITGSSKLFAGIEKGLSSNNNSKAGNIEVNATGAINLNNSQIANNVQPEAGGQGGDVSINASTLRLEGGAQVGAGTFGQGKGGNLTVNASNVQLIGRSADSSKTSSALATQTQGLGDAGNLTINTGTLLLQDRAFASTDTFSAGKGGNLKISTGTLLVQSGAAILSQSSNTGKAGDLTVNATDTAQVIGTSADSDQVPSRLSASAFNIGAAGNLTINTHQLLVKNGAQVLAVTYGQGKGGNLTINASDVQLIGRSTGSSKTSSALATQTRGIGDAGNLTINTGTLLLQDRAFVSTDTFSAGKGGDLKISTGTLLVQSGAAILSQSSNTGKAGDLTVNATDTAQVIGTSADSEQIPSRLSSSAFDIGAAGNLAINTHQLLVKNGAQVLAGTSGQGKGGNLTVDASDVQLIGGSSVLSASALPDSTGDAGDLGIKTNTLVVRDGAQVLAGTSGQGKGGNLTIDASNVQLIGRSADSRKTSSTLATQTQGIGDAGNLTINTGTLLLQDRAFVSTETFSAGKGGDLKISTGTLFVQGGAAILSESFNAGKAGDLTVNATDTAQVIGTSADSDQVPSRLSASAFDIGAAGNLTINTHQLLVKNGAQVLAQSLGAGNAGKLSLNAHSIRLDNGTLSANTLSNNTVPNVEQATIIIHSGDLVLSRGSKITTSARGTNVVGGNININADILAAVENSKISADSVDFRGGQVVISAQGIFLSSDSSITARGATQQLNGTVQINTSDVDSSRGLVTLPTVTENTPKLMSSSCTAFNETAGGSSFTVTGRGGLPPSPDEPLISDVVWTDTRLPVTTAQHQRKTHAAKPKLQPIAIIPATGWVFNDKGEVTLISSVSNPTIVNTPTSCSAR